MICCADLHVDELIQQFATAKHDSKILSITSEKLLVKKAKYHSSLYKDYTRVKKELIGNNDPVKTDISKLQSRNH